MGTVLTDSYKMCQVEPSETTEKVVVLKPISKE